MARLDKFLEGMVSGIPTGTVVGERWQEGRNKRRDREAGKAISEQMDAAGTITNQPPTATEGVTDIGEYAKQMAEGESAVADYSPRTFKPDFADLADEAAMSKLRNGDFKGASAARRGVMDIAQQRSSSLLESAQRAMQMGNPEAAAAYIRQAHDYIPNGIDADVQVNEAGELVVQGRSKKSGQSFGNPQKVEHQMLNDWVSRAKDPVAFGKLSHNRDLLKFADKKFIELQSQFDETMSYKWEALNDAQQAQAMTTIAAMYKAAPGYETIGPDEIFKIADKTSKYVMDRAKAGVEAHLHPSVTKLYAEGPADVSNIVTSLASHHSILTNNIIPAHNVAMIENELASIFDGTSERHQVLREGIASGAISPSLDRLKDGMYMKYRDSQTGAVVDMAKLPFTNATLNASGAAVDSNDAAERMRLMDSMTPTEDRQFNKRNIYGADYGSQQSAIPAGAPAGAAAPTGATAPGAGGAGGAPTTVPPATQGIAEPNINQVQTPQQMDLSTVTAGAEATGGAPAPAPEAAAPEQQTGIPQNPVYGPIKDALGKVPELVGDAATYWKNDFQNIQNNQENYSEIQKAYRMLKIRNPGMEITPDLVSQFIMEQNPAAHERMVRSGVLQPVAQQMKEAQ